MTDIDFGFLYFDQRVIEIWEFMSVRWLIHSRDRTFGPWTSVQVRDELRAGRVDPFDMACKEGSTVKRPLVEVDEIFQSSRVQMAELVEVAGEPEEQKPTRSTKRAVSEPESVQQTYQDYEEAVERPLANTGSSPPPPLSGRSSISDRPRPSQFQALAAATRLNPPNRLEVRKPKQYFVTDSTGRSYGPLSSGEVMKLWHSGRLDSRAVVERGTGSKRISIQKFVEFYQRAAPSGVAFISRVHQPMNARYRTVNRDSVSKPLVIAAALIAVAALFFLAMTMRHRIPPRMGKYLPKSKTSEVERFVDLSKLGAFQERRIRRSDATTGTAPEATPSAVVQNLPPANVTIGGESMAIRPAPKGIRNTSKPARKPARQQPAYRSVPRPRPNPPTASNRRAAIKPPAAIAQSAPPPLSVQAKPKAPVQAKPFVDGETMTLTGYRFSPSDLAQCDGKCKISMSGPSGAVTAVFFKEALGSSFQGKSTVTLTGMMRKQPSGGWSIIVSVAR